METAHLHQILVVLFLFGLVPKVTTDTQSHTDEAGSHCGAISLRPDQSLSPDQHYHCVQCLFPQNCLVNNTCKTGSTGSTCERCMSSKDRESRYHRIGSMCALCPTIPWAAIVLCVYLIALVGLTFFHGFTETVCTKFKLLGHFIQHLILTLHIKIDWPEDIIKLVQYVGFASFNANVMTPDCLFPGAPAMSKHYLEWITSLGLPIAALLFGFFIDKSMKSLANPKRRLAFRRFVCFVVFMMYMPTSVSCIRSYLCSNTVPKELVLDHTKNIFLLDNRVRCETFAYQTIHFFATLYMILMVILLPLMIAFFALRQKKWDLLDSKWSLYGPVYEDYKDGFCFWEAVIMVRTLVAVIVTEAYPFSQEIQVLAQLGMTAVYVLLVVLLRPYRPVVLRYPVFNSHVIFEGVSNVALCGIQGFGLLIVYSRYKPAYGQLTAALVGIVLVVWFVTILGIPCETRHDRTLVQVISIMSTEDKSRKKSKRPKRNILKSSKVDHDSRFEEKVAENKQRIDF